MISRALIPMLLVFCHQISAQTLGNKKGIIYGMSVQSSTRQVAVLQGRNRIEIWNYKTRQLSTGWKEEIGAMSLCWGGNRLAIGFVNGSVKVFDNPLSGQSRVRQISDKPLIHVKYMKDDLFLISDELGNIYILNAGQPNLSHEKIVKGMKPLSVLGFLPDPDIIVGSASEGQISTWSPKGDTLSNQNLTGGYIFDLDYSQKDRLIFLATAKGRVTSFSRKGNSFANDADQGKKVNDWATSVCEESGVLAIGSARQLKIFTKNGTYYKRTHVIVNSIQIISEELPVVRAIIGTQGKGLQIADTKQMKVTSGEIPRRD